MIRYSVQPPGAPESRGITAAPLGLHQITAMEAAPADLIVLASRIGCQEVSVFTHIPQLSQGGEAEQRAPFPLVRPADIPDCLARLRETGLRVANIEFFSLTPWMDFGAYQRGLESGAELGARCAVTHVLDAEVTRVDDHLCRLAEMAASFDMTLAVEFMAASPDCPTIGAAVQLVTRLGRPNLGIAVDMLHLVRSGGTAEDLAAVPADLIRYVQVCDGQHLDITADYMDEALNGRSVPGQGCFPVRAFLDALPADVPLEVEVPRTRLQLAGVGAAERAREAVLATRALIEAHPV